MTATLRDFLGAVAQSWGMTLVFKSAAIAAAGLVAARLASRSRASVRHLILAATFGGLLVLPLVLSLVPPTVAIEVPVLSAESAAVPPMPHPASRDVTDRLIRPPQIERPGASFPAWPTIVMSVWSIGVVVSAASLLSGLWQLGRLRRSAVPWLKGRELARTLAREAGVRRHVELLVHEALAVPATAGVFRPAILLPTESRTWTAAEVQRALVHELEHVRRRDWAIHVVARGTCALYWFNPLVWRANRWLCLEAERACDDAVLACGDDTDYAEQLVRLAGRLSSAASQPALAMAARSDLSARVTAILDTSQPRGRAGAVVAVSALAAMAVVVVTIGPLQAVAVPSNVELSSVNALEGRSGEPQVPGRAGALERALYEAAEEGDMRSIAKLVDAGANVNAAIDGDGSPLIGAARQGRLEAVRYLLDRGADPNMPVSGDGNPLIMAAREGRLEVIELLLDRGADVERVVPGDENALIQASGAGQLAATKLLVARGADVNARVWAQRYGGSGGEWRTALSMARRGRHQAVVQFLRSAGARE